MINQNIISIIIPVYNVESYLIRCVKSVQRQSLKNIEIILVDDGSTDNSGKICDEIALTDTRIKIIHKQNGGLSSARNAGVKIASSDFVGFVDSDDWVSQDMYEYLISLQKKYNADIVSCNYKLSYSYPDIINNNHIQEKYFSRNEALKNYLEMGLYSKQNDYSAWKKIYRRELFDTILFPDGILFEDMPTNFAIIQKCNSYVLSSKICYFYYQNSTSITRNKYSIRHNDLINVSQKIIDLAEDENEDIQKLAHLQLANAYLSLLAKIARYGQKEDVTIDYIVENLVSPFKKRYKYLIFSKISFIKKCVATLFYLNWSFTNKLFRKK